MKSVATLSTAAAMAAALGLSLSACTDGSSGSHPSSAVDGSRVSASASGSSVPAGTVIQRTASGTVLPVSASVPVRSGSTSVITPDGSWEASTSAFGKTITLGKTAYTAPSGQVVVPVTWVFTPPSASTTGSGASSSVPDSPRTKITLVADGKSYTVTNNPTTSSASVVTIPAAAAKNMHIEFTFDGVKQTVSAAGVRVLGKAAQTDGLYDGLSTSGTGVCPVVANNFTGTGGAFTSTCGLVSVSRAAWLPEQGWAGKGQVWVSVTGIVNPGTMTWTDKIKKKTTVTKYNVTGALSGATLAGNQASDVQRNGSSYTMVFKASAGTGSMTLKVNEVLTGKATSDIKAPLTAPSTQKVSVQIVSALTFQKASH